jgi:secreted trypsin-like serine protease
MVGTRIFGLGLSALLFSTIAGCAADAAPNEDEGATSESIIGGQTASAYPEAALINGQGFYCSGAIIAPRIALTAGHCAEGSSFTVKAPFVNKSARGSRVWTDYEPTGEVVNPNTLDVAVIILDTPIQLSSYPRLAQSAVADGTNVVNVGRIKDGHLSTTTLYFGAPVSVEDGAPQFPKSYLSTDIIQSGDSGGPVYAGSGANRTIVAVNSGAGGNTQVLARVDLAYAKIQQLIAANP